MPLAFRITSAVLHRATMVLTLASMIAKVGVVVVAALDTEYSKAKGEQVNQSRASETKRKTQAATEGARIWSSKHHNKI
jgi:hypothetical protein